MSAIKFWILFYSLNNKNRKTIAKLSNSNDFFIQRNERFQMIVIAHRTLNSPKMQTNKIYGGENCGNETIRKKMQKLNKFRVIVRVIAIDVDKQSEPICDLPAVWMLVVFSVVLYTKTVSIERLSIAIIRFNSVFFLFLQMKSFRFLWTFSVLSYFFWEKNRNQ